VDGHCEMNAGASATGESSSGGISIRHCKLFDRRLHMKNTFRSAILVAAVAGVSLLAGCGGVSGNTYVGANGGYTIEFQSGGKAVESLGPEKSNCTYVEDSGKSVTLTCPDGKTIYTIDDKGNLNAPAGSMLGMMGPLTKK
jgi:hypothetical protein